MMSRQSRLLRGIAITLGILGGLAGTGHANDFLIRATADANNWALYGRGYDNTRFSPLSQITAQNAAQLKLAFAFQLELGGVLRSDPAEWAEAGRSEENTTELQPLRQLVVRLLLRK